jgi:hypothetical protein
MTPIPTDEAAVVLAAVRPQFPPFVHDAVFQLRTDHTGDPAVWIWLILDDETDVEERAVQDALIGVQRAIHDRLMASGVDRWPFISVRTRTDQQEQLARGVA